MVVVDGGVGRGDGRVLVVEVGSSSVDMSVLVGIESASSIEAGIFCVLIKATAGVLLA